MYIVQYGTKVPNAIQFTQLPCNTPDDVRKTLTDLREKGAVRLSVSMKVNVTHEFIEVDDIR